MPLLIVENHASKRKTPTAVSIGDKRIFQLDAKNAFVNNPEASYTYIMPLLGKDFNSTNFQKLIKAFKQNDANYIENPERKSIAVQIKSKNITYDLEEILAMILRDAKKLAVNMAGESIQDCVVTVSPEFDHFQRQSLHDALTIAKLKPLAFIHENVAAAIRFAIDEGPPKNTSNVMYVNMGASSLTVTIIKHSKEIDSETKKPADKIEIVGEAWDETMGGRQFDFEMFEILADRFNALPARKNKPDVRKNPKAVRRLMAAAEDYKEKLSAGKTYRIYIDSLLDYVSLADELNREEFEQRLEKFRPRITAVIQAAIQDSKLSYSDIDDVELIGSAHRVPIVKTIISDALKDLKPNQRLNQEEAMSFGAGFLAASLSHSFKVKPMIIVQSTSYDISLDISNIYNETCDETKKVQCSKKPFSYKGTLIKKRTSYDTAKSVTFSYASELSATLYENVGGFVDPAVPRKTATFRITGINEIAEKYNTTPKITMRFEVDAYGIANLVSAKAITEKIITVNVPINITNNETNSTGQAQNYTERQEKVEEKHALTITKENGYPLPMSDEQKEKAIKRLDEQDEAEEAALKKARAKNAYESAIYSARDWLNDDKNQKFIIEKVKEGIISLLSEVFYIG